MADKPEVLGKIKSIRARVLGINGTKSGAELLGDEWFNCWTVYAGILATVWRQLSWSHFREIETLLTKPKQIYDLIQEIHNEADLCNCFAEPSVMEKGTDRSWS